MGASDYPTRILWLKCTVTKETTYGQGKKGYSPLCHLWGSVTDTTSQQAQDYGARQNRTDVTIRVRNFPAVSQIDRLSADGQLYEIDGITNGNNELVISAHRYSGDVLG